MESDGHCLFFSVCDQKGFSQAEQLFNAGPRGVDRPSQGQEDERKVPNLWHNPQRGTITLRLIDMGNQDSKQMLGKDLQRSNVEQVIVEFPGGLLPSFQPTLEALQRMSRHVDIPFSDLLLPKQEPGPVQTSWPAYATQPHFAFNLSPVVTDGEPLYLQHNKPFDFNSLKQRSTLDEAQCKALVGALSRNLALVQGPPGTGKSYIAVQAVKILLECREKVEMNPIICVCYTNHALDQFLKHLLGGGTKQIVRIGTRSKSTILKPFGLREIPDKMERTKTEKGKVYALRDKLGKEGRQVVDLFHRTNHASTLGGVLLYLEVGNPDHYDQLKGNEDSDGFQTVQHQRGDRLHQWLQAPNAPTYTGQQFHSVEELGEVDLLSMSNSERRMPYEHWVSDYRQDLTEQLDHTIGRNVKTEQDLQKCIQEVDLRCLEQAHVIGVTTSGLARYVDLLRRLKPEVLICEEAGEILEAHTLAAFLPSIEHAILIGDHEQLRPGVKNYDLSLENPRGEQYSLDVSTFERLITNPDLEVPHDTLQTQRRMDPSISQLIRNTIYPSLKDHDSVLAYPSVTGVRNRLYWLDHREPETGEDPAQVLQISQSNLHEVDLVQALATHFVRQGAYKRNEVAILTHYVRQLQMLRGMLSYTFEVVIGDKDQDELDQEGLDKSDAGPVVIRKAALKEQIRISTVDNFQGEEPSIVINSLVRSNQEKRCEFLRTSNRINVLLSRAKHGMYIIGNSETYTNIPMWSKVIRILKDAGNFGDSLPLCCPQHPDTSIDVSTPEDFLRKAPEGGCASQCGLQLECGHLCTYKCHPEARHQSVTCHEPCERVHDDCCHVCTRSCVVDCGECLTLVEDVRLSCGHTASGVPCHQMSNLFSVECQYYVEKVLPDCGHKSFVMCGQETWSRSTNCKAQCGADLTRGHQCCKPCIVCHPKGAGAKNHGSCEAPYGRARPMCAHLCSATYHRDSLCPPCDPSCSSNCSHSTWTNRCFKPCAPCAKPCSTTVKQTPVDIGSLVAIETLTYREIDLDETPILVLACGHIILMTTMDRLMGIPDHHEVSESGVPIAFRSESFPFTVHEVKSCPHCQGSLRDLNRYNYLVRRPTLDASTMKFIACSTTALLPLVTKLQREETRLNNTTSRISAGKPVAKPRYIPISPTLVRLGGPRALLFHNISELSGLDTRCGPLLALRIEILTLSAKVKDDEQPFSEIQRTAAQQSQAIHRATVLRTISGLLTNVLLLRCEYDILSEIIKIHGEHYPGVAMQHRWLTLELCVDLEFDRLDYGNLIKEAIQKTQVITEIESRVRFAKFVALERNASIDPDRVEGLLTQACRQIKTARDRVENFPITTVRGQPVLSDSSLATQKLEMLADIEEVERLLHRSTSSTMVTSVKTQSRYLAMTQGLEGGKTWCYCVNMHAFTKGRYAQSARCPQCGERGAGPSEEVVVEVSNAVDVEDNAGDMTYSAQLERLQWDP